MCALLHRIDARRSGGNNGHALVSYALIAGAIGVAIVSR
ncbi:hypothetical protein BRAO375_1070013 [Bradyrhizobium sp. ORS 375]|nr:hypothetical protein BRAO375_1070013 [Bradyrhizobium sp. ORS 375]